MIVLLIKWKYVHPNQKWREHVSHDATYEMGYAHPNQKWRVHVSHRYAAYYEMEIRTI